jgi:RNA polymerase sigma-70 factor (ECF subfamily)
MQEVADATGAPVNTVRSRLRLAKEALAKRIDEDPFLAEALEVAG